MITPNELPKTICDKIASEKPNISGSRFLSRMTMIRMGPPQYTSAIPSLSCCATVHGDGPPIPEFVVDLETCIRQHGFRLAETFPQWGNKCGPVTTKVDFQAMVYEETLAPIMEKHGYTAALWCSMYSLGMVPIVDTSQPNNPNFDVWYTQLMCPWNFPDDCGVSDAELTDDEANGQLVCVEL